MMQALSRRTIAHYAAEQLLSGVPMHRVMTAIAALLVDEGRTKESDRIAADIETALSVRGYTIVRVKTAHPLTEAAKQEIKSLVSADHVIIKEQIDKNLIGGLRIDLPGKRTDMTINHRVAELRAQKK